MTAALLERHTAETGGCRFPDWCNGSCDDAPDRGELSHWSDQASVCSPDVFEFVTVELFGYEVGTSIDPIRVCVSVGDEDCCTDHTTFTPVEARELGNILVNVKATDLPFGDALLWHDSKASVPEFFVEFRQPRELRGARFNRRASAYETPASVEVSIRDSSDGPFGRVRLNLAGAAKLGRLLIDHADRADKANVEFGLVTK